MPSIVSTGRFRRTLGQTPTVLMVGTASGALERNDRDLPEEVVQAARADDERTELLAREGLEARNGGLRFLVVDDQRPRVVADHELDLGARHVLRHLDHLDA